MCCGGVVLLQVLSVMWKHDLSALCATMFDYTDTATHPTSTWKDKNQKHFLERRSPLRDSSLNLYLECLLGVSLDCNPTRKNLLVNKLPVNTRPHLFCLLSSSEFKVWWRKLSWMNTLSVNVKWHQTTCSPPGVSRWYCCWRHLYAQTAVANNNTRKKCDFI